MELLLHGESPFWAKPSKYSHSALHYSRGGGHRAKPGKDSLMKKTRHTTPQIIHAGQGGCCPCERTESRRDL